MQHLVKLKTAYTMRRQEELKILASPASLLYPLIKNRKKLFRQMFFKTGFSFIREAAVGTVSVEAEAMPNGASVLSSYGLHHAVI
jgi:hypothetical protein